MLGSIRVFEACARAGVQVLVHASSVGAYSPGPADGRPVDESRPAHGWPGAAYTRDEKAYLERYLDGFQLAHPDIRLVRMRPAFPFKEESASEQRWIFAGPLLPWRLIRPGLLPALPAMSGLRFQVLHTDAAEAYRAAVVRPVHGPFNLVADPLLDTAAIAAILHTRTVPLPAGAAHAAA